MVLCMVCQRKKWRRPNTMIFWTRFYPFLLLFTGNLRRHFQVGSFKSNPKNAKSNPNHNPKSTLTTARALTHNTCYAHTIKKRVEFWIASAADQRIQVAMDSSRSLRRGRMASGVNAHSESTRDVAEQVLVWARRLVELLCKEAFFYA